MLVRGRCGARERGKKPGSGAGSGLGTSIRFDLLEVGLFRSGRLLAVSQVSGGKLGVEQQGGSCMSGRCAGIFFSIVPVRTQ